MSLKNARQNMFSSPEVSVKQQRLNTDQKAPRMFSENHSNLPVRVDDIVISISRIVASRNINFDKSISLCPTICNLFDTHIVQRAMNHRRDLSTTFPPFFSTLNPTSFYSIAWMICLCGHDADSSSAPSFRPHLESAFEIFSNQYAIGKHSPKENGISKMHEIELASLLLFLSWSPAALLWLEDRQAVDTICNGLLTALSHKGKNPKVSASSKAPNESN